MIRIPSNNAFPAVEIELEVFHHEDEPGFHIDPKIRAYDAHGYSLGVVMLDGIEQLTALREAIDQLITSLAINKSLKSE